MTNIQKELILMKVNIIGYNFVSFEKTIILKNIRVNNNIFKMI